jgi:hypothetical protein
MRLIDANIGNPLDGEICFALMRRSYLAQDVCRAIA